MTAWDQWSSEISSHIRASQRWRTLQVTTRNSSPVAITVDGRDLVSFASNDYYGLSFHPAVIDATCAAVHRHGTSASAARFASGTGPYHHELEIEISKWKRTEAARVFPTGYAANLGVLSALGGTDVVIVSDELNHSSIVDGCRLSRARVEIFQHKNVEQAEELLSSALRVGIRRAIVVTDVVFSMDGDLAPLNDLVALCRRTDALLILDEAHCALGTELLGVDLENVHLLRIGTLSKMLGALGGFVAGSQTLLDLITNLSRPFRFTTASSPADTAAALSALQIIRSAEGALLRGRLRDHVQKLAPDHPSAIIPVILGSEVRALRASEKLLNYGFLVPAHVPPVVPPGTSRLRVALSASHSEEQIEQLRTHLNAIEESSS